MFARKTSDCRKCKAQIDVGMAVRRDVQLGWIHLVCPRREHVARHRKNRAEVAAETAAAYWRIAETDAIRRNARLWAEFREKTVADLVAKLNAPPQVVVPEVIPPGEKCRYCRRRRAPERTQCQYHLDYASRQRAASRARRAISSSRSAPAGRRRRAGAS